ncbi:MAG: adenylyl-sulfate kinase [Bradymonadia bacterium]
MTITRHTSKVSPEARQQLVQQNGGGLWITGLSASGKSTLAMALERRLVHSGRPAFVLDGDNLRYGLCGDLGFTPEDRQENIRRAGHVMALMAQSGLVSIGSFISPYARDRAAVRALFDAPPLNARFAEIYVSTTLDVCEARDPKGLYRKARAGELQRFTGISAPYEAPTDADLVIDMGHVSVADAVEKALALLQERAIIPQGSGILPASNIERND